MLIIILGRTVLTILALLTMRIATSLLPPAEMGRLSLIVTTTTLFALFLVSPVGMFINRRVHSWYTHGLVERYLQFHRAYLVLVCLGASLTLVILSKVKLVDFHTGLDWLLFLVCVSLFSGTINTTVIPTLNLIGFRSEFVLLSVATAASGLLIAWTLSIMVRPSAEYWLSGLLFGQIVFGTVGYQILMSKVRREVEHKPMGLSKRQMNRLFVFAWPMGISALLLWSQMQGYRFLIDEVLGLQALGLFVAGYGISAGIVGAFEAVITNYLQPFFYERVSNGDKREQSIAWNQYAGVVIPSLILVVGLITAIAPELTRFMLGPAYQAAFPYVIWGAFIEAGRVIVNVYVMVSQARMKPKLLILPNLVGALGMWLSVVWLARSTGLPGVGMGLVCAGLTVVIIMHQLMRKELDIHLPYWFLVRVTIFGGLLVVLAGLARSWAGVSITHFTALLIVSLPAISFVVLQYFLIGPLIPFERIGSQPPQASEVI